MILCFIFDPRIQKELIHCPQLEALPVVDFVDYTVLRSCDIFLEGALIDKTEVLEHGFVKSMKFSDLILKKFPDPLRQQIPFIQLLIWISSCLQSDMYGLDEFEFSPKNPKSGIVRTLTSTILPEHRKLSIRDWSHMELLTNPGYRKSNLRISNGTPETGSSFIFHLGLLKSVIVSDCVEIAPVVLGFVTDFVILKNLKGCRISVVTKRLILIDCNDITVFCETESRPIVTGSCCNICFGPYNVWFDAFDYELSKSNVVFGNETWNDPVVLMSSYQLPSSFQNLSTQFQNPPSSFQNPSTQFLILEEEAFYLQPVPFPSKSEYSRIFKETLGQYLTTWLKRRKSASHYVQNLPELELCPLPPEDQNYLKKKIKQ